MTGGDIPCCIGPGDAADSEPDGFLLRSLSASTACFRPRLVKGRLAGPISCECCDTSAGAMSNETMRSNNSRTAYADFICVKVGLVADGCLASGAFKLKS